MRLIPQPLAPRGLAHSHHALRWAAIMGLFIATPALAWNTDSCPTTNPGTGDCTCVSNGVQSSGNYGPVGCGDEFQPNDTIGVWQSVNSPPTGVHTWAFDYGYKATADSTWQAQSATNDTTMNIAHQYNFWNVWDDKFNTHPSGYYRVQVYFDGTAVAGGYKEFAICGSNYRRACSGGDPYWYDACGDRRDRAQDCGAGTCTGGACVCDPHAYTVCHNGDLWYVDCNGNLTSKKTECGAGTCTGGACVCDPHASSACYNGDLWYYDCDGQRTSKQTDCGAGTCTGGACICDLHAYTVCHNGDVWYVDCNGNLTSKQTECGAGTCTGGACVCDPQASSACYNGDLWYYDCGGQRTSKQTDCGAGTCTGGACVCDPQASSACHDGDLWWLDCDGDPSSLRQTCQHGACTAGACPGCDPNASTACHSGDVWNLDCDGVPTSKQTECGAGTCTGGACVCDPQASSACYGGDLWYYDCDGHRTSKQTECGAGTCTGGVCVCDPQASSACHDGDLWWLNCDGAPSSLRQTCQHGACTAGACPGCDPNTSTACYSGDVWNLDCDGVPTSKQTECGDRACDDGACQDPAPTGAFDPTCVISDDLFRDTAGMDAAAVQAFLETRAGRLSQQNLDDDFALSYPGTVDYDTTLSTGTLGRLSSPADIIALSPIHGAIHISPRALLVTLQKEQSLIDSYARATQSALDWATGYAVFEGSGPTPRYKGFFGQVIATAWQYDHDFEALAPGVQPAMTIDGQTIVPKNRATAVLYKYTPHIHGAQLFWTLWRRYFGDTGTCGTTPADPPPTGHDDIELHCTHTGPYSVLGWAFDDERWHIVPGSPYHLGDDIWADDWNTLQGGCDTEKTLGPMWVHAVASGTILFVGDASNGYGHQVIVRLSDDPTYAVRYAHLDDREAWTKPWQAGDTIQMGDIIGAVGDTGTGCAHLHLVLYCNITEGSDAESRLSNGRAPSHISGGATKHATWFRLDPNVGQDIGGSWPGCRAAGGITDGDFVGAGGLTRGCTGDGELTALWFMARANQTIDLDLSLDNADTMTPSWGLVELLDDSGALVPTMTIEQAAGTHRLSATLPEAGRWWVRVHPSESGETRWRLANDAVTDSEADEYDLAKLVPPGTDEVHALDLPGDRDLFLLGAIADHLTVRVEPTGRFPSPNPALAFYVIGPNGELAPYAGTWQADGIWQRSVDTPAEALYLEVTGDPGLYRLTVTRSEASQAEPGSQADAGHTPAGSTSERDDEGCAATHPTGALTLSLWLVWAAAFLIWRRRATSPLMRRRSGQARR